MHHVCVYKFLEERLGVMGVEEIKAHPFFAGVDWRQIRNRKAFNIPELKNDSDTKYFESLIPGR